MLQRQARAGLRRMFPQLGAWTSAALWHGLHELPVPTTALDGELGVIVRNRLAGLLLSYADTHRVLFPRAQLDLLRSRAFHAAALSDAVTAGCRSALEIYADRGIDTLVTKGPAISATFAGLTHRPYSDIDLLVRPGDFRRAIAALRAAGWTEDVKSVPPREYFVTWCREGINLHRARTESIDVHQRVPPWRWSNGLQFDDLYRRATRIVRAGVGLPCASIEDNLLIAALHIVSDHNRAGQSLMVWRDVRQLVERADHETVVQLAERSGLQGWLAAVLEALPEPVRPQELAGRLPADQPVSSPAHLAALLSVRSSDIGLPATQFLRLPLRNGLAFLGGMAVPSRAFVQAKFGAQKHPYLTWWRHRLRIEPA